MATLELKYSADQRHQVEAVEAITDLFRGQEFLKSEFTAEVGAAGTLMEGQVLSVGSHGCNCPCEYNKLSDQYWKTDVAFPNH